MPWYLRLVLEGWWDKLCHYHSGTLSNQSCHEGDPGEIGPVFWLNCVALGQGHEVCLSSYVVKVKGEHLIRDILRQAVVWIKIDHYKELCSNRKVRAVMRREKQWDCWWTDVIFKQSSVDAEGDKYDTLYRQSHGTSARLQVEVNWVVEHGLEGLQGIKINAWRSRKLKTITQQYVFALGCCKTKWPEYTLQ